MPNVQVVTDSLADIPQDIAEQLEITQVPCIVRFGDHEFRDRVDLYPTEFYRRLVASPTLPTTSQPVAGEFEAVYRKIGETTDQIISIHVIGNLSGTLNAARLGAENVPHLRIEHIDSKQVTMGMGWLVILAARAAQAGASLDEIKKMTEDIIPRIHVPVSYTHLTLPTN